MSSPCLSSILTHANLTMYQSCAPDPHQQQCTVSPQLPAINTMQIPSPDHSFGMMGQWYKYVNPQHWTMDNVLEWISDHIDNIKFDANTLCLDYCTIDGASLCEMNQSQMVGIFGQQLGLHLHQSLQEHKAKHEFQILSGTELSETCKLLEGFLDNLSFPFLSTLKVAEACDNKREFDCETKYDLAHLSMVPINPLRETGYLSDSEYSSSSFGGGFGFPTPSSPESRSSDSDPEFSCPQIAKENIKIEKEETRVKRPRGRPPKLSRNHDRSFTDNLKKSKNAPRSTHLWEFIRDILINPERNQGLMKWEDRREGVFKFLKSEAVAQMWGQNKKNTSMTYEKLSRAMRYYYKREILERVDGRRLVYKFGKNSSGWKIEETGMAM